MMSFLIISKIIIFLLFTSINFSSCFNNNNNNNKNNNNNAAIICNIPNQQSTGICQQIDFCEKYKELKTQLQTTNSIEKLQFLRKIQCVENGESETLICCPQRNDTYRNPSIRVNRNAIKRSFQRVAISTAAKKPSSDNNEFVFETRFGEADIPAVLPKSCGVQFTNKIMGGEIADLDEFPWVALLIYNSTRRHMYGCGGSLISNRYVLTAAHCVTGDTYNKKGGLKYVRLGEYDTQNEIFETDCIYDEDDAECADAPIDVPYEEIIIHPDYDVYSNDKHNDIALIRLSETVKFTGFIKPICIPLEKYNTGTSTGNLLSISGWGKTDIFQEKYGIILSPIKLKLKLPYVDQDRCSRAYRTQKLRLGRGQLCAGGERAKDTCPGDSGSPLMNFDRSSLSWVQVGIVSLGLEFCGTEGVPGVYTKVDQYVDWIINNMRI